MEIQKRLLIFITRTNWVLLFLASVLGVSFMKADFVRGIVFGGLIVTVNFHLLARTLKKALTPPYMAAYQTVLAKYYLRFIASGLIIFILISNHFVNLIGLFIGLSIVVASIFLAMAMEIKNLFLKEAM